ncbi:carbohydrate-binding module family 13 protein [Dendrothele bispora CBS 962.96]|uniref:Carbohydrate-binding module family 13 protein n=1 Tax=Dendrothele bispora (strain CBS 962.96) TaxID=1314807 RepID=A0A4S8M3V0_DENBC|nr:carbohydrate-binding module family 13 protein [Dendrothele bispora CBS 962.96]
MTQPQADRAYKIVNAQTGTVLDVSDADKQTISGYTDHGGINQKFMLEQNWRGSWYFRITHLDHDRYRPRYVGIGAYLGDGTPLIANEDPFAWNISPDEQDNSVYRIYAPIAPAPLNWDLSDHENATPGAIVRLWGKWEGRHQCWKFVEV